MSHSVTLSRSENQALGLGKYAVEFMQGKWGDIGPTVLEQTNRFHLDSIACAVSALACGTNAPTVLRCEALDYRVQEDNTAGCTVLGSTIRVKPEKAVLANSAAAREWDSNGTNFGYNPARGATQGEFGHNDFYPVPLAAAQLQGLGGSDALRGMVLLDEIRGRLAEVFALRRYKIDHVVHGAIASAATFGAMLGATPEQIESAIGMVVAHYIPFRAIRAGKQLSDSKGASAAISTEMAVLAVLRSLRGFVGPADIFRNPEALFCLFEPPEVAQQSPFDLTLSTAGDDFAVMGMHFKLGLYEHQSAGAIAGLIDMLAREPELIRAVDKLQKIRVLIYQPAYGIICDPAKRNPTTRQSADHSMIYILAQVLRKATETASPSWENLMLLPEDYSDTSLADPLTRQLMEKIEVLHGGPEFDARYPDGIPTEVQLQHATLGDRTSGLVMYPPGHARYAGADVPELLDAKFRRLGSLAVDNVDALRQRFLQLETKSADEIAGLFDFRIRNLE